MVIKLVKKLTDLIRDKIIILISKISSPAFCVWQLEQDYLDGLELNIYTFSYLPHNFQFLTREYFLLGGIK